VDETGQSYRATIARFLAVGFVALLGVIVSTGVLMTIDQRQTGWIMHTYQVQREIGQIRLTVTQLIGVKAGNRLRASHRGTEQAAALKTTLDASIDRLARMTGDNPRQQARMPLLKASASLIEGQAGLDVPLDARIGTLSDDPGEVVAGLCVAMQDEETRLLDLRNARRADISSAFYAILGLTGVLLTVVALLGFTTIRSYTREIQRSRRELAKANSGLEAAVQERTGELMRANAEIQRFAYIVSHDLRSPLVNIMGFTAEIETATRSLQDELDKALAERPQDVSPIVRTAITEDMPEAIDFIRTSARKMDRLINAILQLSRLGRRRLNPEWLDLPALVQNVVDTVQQQIADAGATAEIVRPMPQIFADGVALEQILANLVENAIKYRHAARPLHMRVWAERRGERIVIAVADNGRGIDPRDSERVFDLFRRAGVQDQPGEGIGLAHVRALAYRLGGTISLESAAGAGSTFTLILPVRYDEDQGSPA
jgi:signal transduction histidine kinase